MLGETEKVKFKYQDFYTGSIIVCLELHQAVFNLYWWAPISTDLITMVWIIHGWGPPYLPLLLLWVTKKPSSWERGAGENPINISSYPCFQESTGSPGTYLSLMDTGACLYFCLNVLYHPLQDLVLSLGLKVEKGRIQITNKLHRATTLQLDNAFLFLVLRFHDAFISPTLE